MLRVLKPMQRETTTLTVTTEGDDTNLECSTQGVSVEAVVERQRCLGRADG
jgi:hypothetical protein